jgi:hypothetical protein
MGIGHSVEQGIHDNKAFFDNFLILSKETAGIIDTNLKTIQHTAIAKGLYFKTLPEYPKSSGIVSWHTHPDAVEDRLKKDGVPYPLGAIPSNIDIMTSLTASLGYKEPTINVIISKKGLCLYYPDSKIITFLLSRSEKERQDILKNIVRPNLEAVYGQVFFSPDDQIKKFIREMKSITRPGEGFHIKFRPWK